MQVHRWTIKALYSRYLQCLGRFFNICPLFVLDLNHSDQWNTLLSAGGEIFQLTNLVTLLGISCIQLFWSSSVYNSCMNPSSIFFNSFKWDLLSNLYYLGLKFPDLFISESFRFFMLFYHFQFDNIYLDLVFFDLIHHSLFCFGHLQGTAVMLCTRSGATAWT